MDENRNLAREVGGKVNTANQKQRDAAKRIKRMKRLIKYAPILLWVLGISIPVIIFLAVISNNTDKKTAMTSKQANISAIKYSGTVTEEDSPNRIMVDVNNRNSDGAYELSYSFKDEDGNEISEIEALEKIKLDLLKENGNLDLSKFSDSELNIIGALMYNGLKIEQYNEAELKALVVFLKADIAGQSFDLRPKDQIGQPIPLSELSDNDLVYGTLQVQRVKIEEVNGVLDYKEELLEYIPYGDETTQDTFCYMVKNNDDRVINNFTINEKGELLYAQLSKTNITYSYSLNGEQISVEQAQAIIPEENLGEPIQETNIRASQPIDYKSRIKTYVASYGLLSDLLETTKNVDFCIELAGLALNSRIVININEETTIKNETEIATYDQTTLLYDYVKYEISGTKSNTSKSWTKISSADGDPSASTELAQCGWSSSFSPVRETGENGRTYYYEWSHGGQKYQLKYINLGTYKNWTLYVEKEKTTENSLALEKNNPADGELINNYTEPTLENELYTGKEEITYTITKNTQEVISSCKIEVGNVDSWCMKYEKKYNTPIAEPLTIPENYETTGEFSEMSEGVQVPISEIEQDPHVLKFKTDRIKAYKNRYGASDVTLNFTGLTIKQRIKTDVSVTFQALEPNISYKFGEEIVDTTEISWKNVIFINNQPQYTSYIDENEETLEIGFLYIYNKYIIAGIDLYLQNDSENKLFELLESDPQTANSANIVKYLLFVYDGIDRGVTEFDLSIYKPSEFKSRLNGSSLLAEVLKSYENAPLRLYMNEESNNYNAVKDYVKLDRSQYKMYYTSNDGCLNFSYGIKVYSENGINNEGYFTEEGIELQSLIDQYNNGQDVYVDVDVIDRIYLKILNDRRDMLKQVLEEHGVSLKSYQIDALINVSYQYGNCGQILDGENNIANMYKKYYETDPEAFKNNAICEAENGNLVKFFVTGNYINREKYNWLLFHEGRYFLEDGTEIESASAVAEFALQFVGENHSRFTSYNPTNDVQDIWYGADWCAMFVSYCYNECGLIPDVLNEPFAGCPTEADILKGRKQFIDRDTGYIPEPGDIIFFTKNGRTSNHVGLVVDCDGTTVYTVEGNTGDRTTSPYWKGSIVEAKEYQLTASKILRIF